MSKRPNWTRSSSNRFETSRQRRSVRNHPRAILLGLLRLRTAYASIPVQFTSEHGTSTYLLRREPAPERKRPSQDQYFSRSRRLLTFTLKPPDLPNVRLIVKRFSPAIRAPEILSALFPGSVIRELSFLLH